MSTYSANQPQRRPGGRSAFWLLTVGVIVSGVVAAGLQGYGQQQRNIPPPSPRPTLPNYDPLDMPPVYAGGDPIRAKADARRLQYLNVERQKSMVADTNRLVKLASDLNAQVNGEQHGQLTPDQVKQLAEIEKLAHNIREKMSTSVRPAPGFESQPVMLPPP